MSSHLDGIVRAFRDAAGAFADLVDRSDVGQKWAAPSAMEGYTVGALVGHVKVAVGYLEPALEAPPPTDLRPIRVGSYFAGMKIEADGGVRHPLHDRIRDMSEEAAAPGWDATGTSFRALIDRLVTRLDGESSERVLDLRPIIPVAIRLGDFLRTRIVDVVVHTDDLAASIGVDPPAPSPGAAAVAIEVMLASARKAHGDVAVVRALARGERATASVFPVF